MNTLPILNYHGIEGCNGRYSWTDEERPYVIPVSAFEAQMMQVTQKGFSSLDLKELEEWFEGKDYQRPIVLTFDDGYVSHYEQVLPCLRQMKMKGIFFISAAWIGKKAQMSWGQLKELLSEGFEIGSHGLNHVPLTHLSEKELREELKHSKETLEQQLGVKVTSFSVPRGFYDRRIRTTAVECGYRFVFTSQFDLNQKNEDRLCLRRLVVKKGLSLNEFSRMIEGELGLKRNWERLKAMTRSFISPPLYDFLAGIKRSMKVEG